MRDGVGRARVATFAIDEEFDPEDPVRRERSTMWQGAHSTSAAALSHRTSCIGPSQLAHIISCNYSE